MNTLKKHSLTALLVMGICTVNSSLHASYFTDMCRTIGTKRGMAVVTGIAGVGLAAASVWRAAHEEKDDKDGKAPKDSGPMSTLNTCGLIIGAALTFLSHKLSHN